MQGGKGCLSRCERYDVLPAMLRRRNIERSVTAVTGVAPCADVAISVQRGKGKVGGVEESHGCPVGLACLERRFPLRAILATGFLQKPPPRNDCACDALGAAHLLAVAEARAGDICD